MRLKKLKISGFKSFADPITLTFDREILAVVGPNGCGKSNIVDAIRWVLGEQSVRSMRAKAMQDVLFSGTDKRPAANMAEVAVTLTDVGEALPVPHDEVTICRRLYRNGDSEYLLNREPIRLRELQHIFMGTGVGKNAFSIFEQGKIDRIIHLSQSERRAIFDEAAGIGRFLEKKKETARKLASAAENYHRLKDIHTEVEKQVKQLKRQAKEAKSYQENKEGLERLEHALIITKMHLLHARGVANEDRLKALQEALASIETKIEGGRECVATVRREVEEKQHRLDEIQERFYAARSQHEILTHENKRAEEREKELAALGDKLLQEVKNQEQKREKSLEIQERLTSELEKLDHKRTALFTEAGEKLKALQAFKETLHLDEKRVQELGSSRLHSVEQEGAAHKTVVEIESLFAKLAEKEQALEEINTTPLKQEVDVLSAHIDTLSESVQTERAKIMAAKEELASRQKEHDELARSCTQLHARFEMLTQLKKDLEGFSKGAKTLIKELKLVPLAEGFSPTTDEERIACAHYTDTLIVKNKTELKKALLFAKEKGLSGFSLWINKGSLQGERFEGCFVDHNGVVFAGQSGSNPFARLSELKMVETALKEKGSLLEREQSELKAVQKKLAQMGKEVGELEQKRHAHEMELVQKNFAYQSALQLREELTQEIQELDKQGLLTKKKDAEREQEKARLNRIALDDEHAAAEQAMQQKRSEREHLESGWHQGQRAVQEVEKQLHELQAQLQVRDAEVKHAERRLQEIAGEQKEGAASLELCKRSQKSRQQEWGLVRKGLEQHETEHKDATRALSDVHKREKELEKQLSALYKELKSLEKETHKEDVKRAEAQSSLRDLIETSNVTLEGALKEEPLEGDLTEHERQAKQLRHLVESKSRVNLMAIDEYQESEGRFQDLSEQLHDLEKGKSDLEEVIVRLDRESRKLFKETFAKIRTNFQKNFEILFNGGNADLSFAGSSDVLEAGIDITAKPPGKQMRSISLLSGGEKCLTALALLFAIFEVRPAPFCILDEVDAPLDESNIDRFTEMLFQFTEKTQFIIVTHNKKTMEKADLLIGVSMEEMGVSTLISLRLSHTTETTTART